MNNIKSVLLGLACSFACTIILLLCFSFISVNASIREDIIPIFIIILFSISIFCGAIITTKKINKNGAGYGGGLACMYILLIYTISSIYIGNFSIEKTSVYMALCGVFLGILGGIIGVNIK